MRTLAIALALLGTAAIASPASAERIVIKSGGMHRDHGMHRGWDRGMHRGWDRGMRRGASKTVIIKRR